MALITSTTPLPTNPSSGFEAMIGLATSSTPYGPWTDKGYLISSWSYASSTATMPTNSAWNFSSSTTWNAIDPAPFMDASGNWWLIFGSWLDGTHLMQLQTPNSNSSYATIGFPVASGSNAYPVSSESSSWTTIGYRGGAGEEGPFIYYWNGYYYYFAPINVCCQGTSSTYREIVGRSTSVTRPYYDRGGVNLANFGGTILISSHGNIFGPGGASVFTDTGTGWLQVPAHHRLSLLRREQQRNAYAGHESLGLYIGWLAVYSITATLPGLEF